MRAAQAEPYRTPAKTEKSHQCNFQTYIDRLANARRRRRCIRGDCSFRSQIALLYLTLHLGTSISHLSSLPFLPCMPLQCHHRSYNPKAPSPFRLPFPSLLLNSGLVIHNSRYYSSPLTYIVPHSSLYFYHQETARPFPTLSSTSLQAKPPRDTSTTAPPRTHQPVIPLSGTRNCHFAWKERERKKDKHRPRTIRGPRRTYDY